MTATAPQPADNPTEQQVRPHDQAAWISAIPPDRKWMRFARLIQRPGRVLGGLAVRAAFGSNQSLTWLPRGVVPVAQGGRYEG